MTAADVLSLAKAAGVRLSLEGGRIVATPKGAISDELRRSIRENREALRNALAVTCPAAAQSGAGGVTDVTHVTHLESPSRDGGHAAAFGATVAAVTRVTPSGGDGQEARRQRVLAMLADLQTARYAVLTDAESDPEAVILALAIRGVGTCELRVPRPKYNPFLLMQLIDRHGGTVH